MTFIDPNKSFSNIMCLNILHLYHPVNKFNQKLTNIYIILNLFFFFESIIHVFSIEHSWEINLFPTLFQMKQVSRNEYNITLNDKIFKQINAQT